MDELGWGELMLAGGLAGMVSWSVSACFAFRPRPTRVLADHPSYTLS